MRKKLSYIILISIFIIVTIIGGGFFMLNQTTSPNTNETEPLTQKEESASEPTDDKQTEEETEDQSVSEEEQHSSITDEIKDTVQQVVDHALNIFIKNDLKIVAIGDSLTQGVGDTTNNGGYVGILKSTLKDKNQSVEIKNYGKRGNRSDQLLERLDQTEIATSIEEADIVLVTIGANDIMKVVKNNFTNLEYEPFAKEHVKYTERLRQIVEKITSLNADTDLYFIGFYNPFEKYFSDIEQLGLILDNWNASSQKMATEYDQVNYIPTADLFQPTDDNLLADDNFHPNVNGYQLIAQRVLDHIEPSLEKAGPEETEESNEDE